MKILMRFPEGRAKALTFSYDDGVKQDIRLVEILNKHGMKGTFNVNSGLYAPEGQVHRRMTEQAITELFKDSGHEVAVHAYTHPFLETLSPANITWEILKDREALEKQFGTLIRGMAYPYGSHSNSVVEVLRNCGIVYARTTVSTERFGIPTDWLRMPATCHHNNPRLMELADKFITMSVSNHPQLFYLWGHSYEFDDHNNWNVIEEFTDRMAGKEDEIWYATNIEIYEYIEDYNRLIWSADGSIVKNPTARTIWFRCNGADHSVAPGETLKLNA
ncbi:MAG: polysaccharide deacetylase [Ruminococcaceae bacterium]|nr:polysaccharide deacetylase [Oscillospiraceae bacterium]